MLYRQYSVKKLAKSGLQYHFNASFSICTSIGRQYVFTKKPFWNQATCTQVLSV